MRVLILASTMTGTAEMLAENLGDAAAGAQVRVVLAERISAAEVLEWPLLVVVSSTYGDGEVPEPARALFAQIEAAGALDGMAFGVVGLGDRSLYAPTFANGGRQWDQMLEQAGAARLLEPLYIDVSGDVDMSAASEAWFARFMDCAGSAGHVRAGAVGSPCA